MDLDTPNKTNKSRLRLHAQALQLIRLVSEIVQISVNRKAQNAFAIFLFAFNANTGANLTIVFYFNKQILRFAQNDKRSTPIRAKIAKSARIQVVINVNSCENRQKRTSSGSPAGRRAVLEELAETGTARQLAEGVVHDGVCLTTVRRAEGVAKREELAVKRPVPPRFRLLTEGPPLLPAGTLTAIYTKEARVISDSGFSKNRSYLLSHLVWQYHRRW